MSLGNNPELDLIERWLAHLSAARGRRPRTLEIYRLALLRLVEFLEGKPLSDANEAELEAFAGLWLHKRGVVARSRKPYVSAVKGFYAWLARTGRVMSSAADALAYPKVGRPLPRSLTLDNAERLMWKPDLNTFIGIRDAAMLSLLVGCGMRVSGLVALNEGALRNEAVDGKVRMLVRVVEKGDRERVLPVPREADMLLRVYLEHERLRELDRDVKGAGGRPDRVLFVNARNTRVGVDEYRGEALRLTRHSVWKLLQNYGEAAGIPADQLHPHAIRHLFGTELAESGEDLLVRQHLMGHVDPKSTAIYTEMAMRRKLKVIDTAAPLGKMNTPVSQVLKRLNASTKATNVPRRPPGTPGETEVPG